MESIRRRLFFALGALATVLGAGASGFYLLGNGQWAFIDCLYMTVITLTTVGYGEVLSDFHEVEFVRVYTMVLIVLGTGLVLYFVSTLTAIIIEGDLKRAFREKRMLRTIEKLRNHVVVCGLGSTGRHVMEELAEYDIPVVIIDISEERIAVAEERSTAKHIHFLVGDATDDAVLEKSNIGKARGLVAALSNDKENLFLVLSARQANPDARIVARGSDLRVLEKLSKAGADTVVSPNYIGGLRMVSELIRPKVTRFLDEMRKDKSKIRIDEVDIPDGSPFAGKSLLDIDFRRSTEILVLAVRNHDEKTYDYNPKANFVLDAGMTLVVMGPIAEVRDLRTQVRG